MRGGAARAQDSVPPETTDEERLRRLEERVQEQGRELEELRRTQARQGKEPESESSAPRIRFEDGFYLSGKLGGADYEVRPRGQIQLDYRAYPHAAVNDLYQQPVQQDQFLVRRARLGFEGTFAAFAFDLELDLARSSSQLPLANFFFQYQELEELRLRFGHFKVPLDYEDGVTPDRFTDTIERPMIVGSGQAIAASYRPGAEVLGSLGGGLLQYWLAVQSEVDSNTAATSDPETTARLATEVSGLVLGAGGSWENRSGIPAGTAAPSSTQQSFALATPGQFVYFKPVLVRGWTQRYAVDVSYYQGPFSLRAEFLYGSQERWRVLADHGSGTGLVTQGGHLTLGYVFFAPPSSAHSGKPFEGWELCSLAIEKHRNAPTVGAELVTRLEWASADDTHGGRRGQGNKPALPSTAPNADQVKGNDAKAVTVGLNLSPIPNVRFMADWVFLRIGDQSRSERPHSREAQELLFRAQLAF